MATKKYKVRDKFTLHKVIIDGQNRKTTQPYQSGSVVELSEAEAKHYQHLIEPATTRKEATK